MADKKTTTKKAVLPTEIKDLEKALTEKQADLSQAIRSHRAGELVNPRVLRELRRDIARIKTAIRANELGKEK
jgi:ribosomal protein L29